MNCEFCGSTDLFFLRSDSVARCNTCGMTNEIHSSIVAEAEDDEGSYEMPEVEFN